MNWAYVAGYFDGEGSLLFCIIQDKRSKSKNSQVEGWNIAPSLSLTSFDREVLRQIKQFLESQGIKVYKLETKTQRKGQTDYAIRLSVFGWDNVKRTCKKLIPFSIAKQEQFIIFLSLHKLWEERPILPSHSYHKRAWTKETFIEAMTVVDAINSLKSGKRGKNNARKFIDMWGYCLPRDRGDTLTFSHDI